VACAAVGAAPPDPAQFKDLPAPTVPAPATPREADAKALLVLESVLPRLDSPSVFDRLEAQDEARRVVGSRLATVEAVLARPTLSPEQTERLSSLGYSIFATQPRAAMGVRFGLTQAAGAGVVIDGAVPGFDSARVLLPGDIIITIAGVEVHEQMDARRIIISFDPGEEIPMEISRQGQVRDVAVRLGSYADLNNGFRAVDSATLRLAWETRAARLRRAAPETSLPTGLPQDRLDTYRAQAILPNRPFIRMRGQVESGEFASTGGDGPLLTPGGRTRAPALTFNRPFRFRAVKNDVLADLEARSDQADKWALQNRAIEAALRDAKLPPEQRLRHEFNLFNNRKQVLQGANERREVWRTLRAELEATEEPH
jgi:hypothetical protein